MRSAPSDTSRYGPVPIGRRSIERSWYDAATASSPVAPRAAAAWRMAPLAISMYEHASNVPVGPREKSSR